MRLFGREEELAELARLEGFSRKKLFVVAVYGLRRVGKTRLLLEFLKGRGLYFFVNKNKTSADLLSEFQQILKDNKMLGELEVVDTWDKLFGVLAARNAPPAVFDEFQNFNVVEPAIFGILQKHVDLNEEKPGFVILSGSLIGLMKKMFKDSKEPLYGRIKKGVKLEPLPLKTCLQICAELKLAKEEAVKAYSLFGGYPKYYVAVEDFCLQGKTAEEIVDALFLEKDAPLEDEVNSILSQEFGGRSGVYYSILEAIACGSNTLSAIAGYLNTPATSITRQINELRDYFELIELEKPFRGKRGVYRIRHPLMHFWFSQFYGNYSDYAARNPEFLSSLKDNLNAFFGRRFETAAKEFVALELGLAEARRQWGKIEGAAKGENAYEIDLMAESGKNAFAFEFKWKEMALEEAASVLKELEGKARHVPELPASLKFGVVAKRIREKQELRAGGYLAFDLDDF